MRFFKYSIVLMLLARSFAPLLAHADVASVSGAGNADLVLEDETTRQTLFNMGNPAGMAFLPKENRSDLSIEASQRNELEQFTTTFEDLTVTAQLAEGGGGMYYYDWSARMELNQANEETIVGYSAVTTTTTIHYLFYPNTDSEGNTLPPNTVFTWKGHTNTLRLLSQDDAPFQGVLAWPMEQLALQLIPVGSYAKTLINDRLSPAVWQAGGKLRGAYQILPNASVGAGITGVTSSWTTSELSDRSYISGLEAGLAYRLSEVFDSSDQLNLGLSFTGGMENKTTDVDDLTVSTLVSTSSYTEKTRPASVGIQGIYSYKALMDVALKMSYAYEDSLLTWDNRTLTSYALRSIDYDLQFRVRLPMVRNDDLRFGVSFNNRSEGHPYPTGRLETLNTATGQLNPEIDTSTSGIGIGMALVPGEGSLIALQYNLGSSKSRQTGVDETIADSGYSQFSLGGQWRILDWLTVRGSYVDQTISYESQSNYVRREIVITDTSTVDFYSGTTTVAYATTEQVDNTLVSYLDRKSTYTQSFRLGVGYDEGPWSVNLTGVYTRIRHNPYGWDIPEKPVDLTTVNKDKVEEYKAVLSVSRRL